MRKGSNGVNMVKIMVGVCLWCSLKLNRSHIYPIVFPSAVFAQEDYLQQHRKYQREKRRVEREKRKEERHRQRQRQQEEYYYYSSEESQNEGSSSDLNLFEFKGPRNVVIAAKDAAKSLAVGLGSGFVCLVASPYLLSSKGPVGVALGFMFGVLGALGTTFIGATTAFVQILVGLWNTPKAIYASWFEGKLWDPYQNDWKIYRLDEEIEELLNSETSRTSVQDTFYYDILNLKPGCTSKEIKRAYYSMAKEVHPDKNPEDDEESAARFVQLHKAYQTLIDPESRDAYDNWGKSSSSSKVEDLNIDVFFEVLFGSQLVEPYVGQLAVASFVKQAMQFSNTATSNDATAATMDFTKFLQASQTQQRKRAVQIAHHLREHTRVFVDQTISDADFQDKCAEEANEIATTAFGEKFLVHIGKALIQEADLYLQRSIFQWPLWIYSTAAKKTRAYKGNISGLKMVYDFGRNLVEDQDIFDETSFSSSASKTNKKTTRSKNATKDKKSNDELLEEFLPQILDLAWAYIARDIKSLIEMVSYKIFNDADASSSERARRAKALKILGKTFLKRGLGNEKSSDVQDSDNNPYCEDSEMNKIAIMARLQVALQMSKLEDSRPSREESEEMIRRAKMQG